MLDVVDGAWPSDEAERVKAVGTLTDAAQAEAARALPMGSEPAADRFVIMSARVALGSVDQRRRLKEGVELREGATEAENAWQQFLRLAANVQKGRPGIVQQALLKEKWFDGEGTRVEVHTTHDRQEYGGPLGLKLWVRFMRSFSEESGTRIVQQVLSYDSGRHLRQDVSLRGSGHALNKFAAASTQIEQPPVDWLEALRVRFDPIIPLGELSVQAWLDLLTEPLDTTHILRNHGNPDLVPRHPILTWAHESDIGTERGEMSIDDVFISIMFAIEGARDFGSMPSGDDFALIRAELKVPGIPKGGPSVEMSSFSRDGLLAKVDGSKAPVEEAQKAYDELYAHVIRNNITPERWTALAEKTIQTGQGKTTVVIRASRIAGSKKSPIEDRAAEIVCYQTISEDFAVEHVLRVDEHFSRGVVRIFDNTRRLLKRDPQRAGEFVVVESLPEELAPILVRHTDIMATYTYNRWYELLKRPLEPTDVIT